jgi:hypothetical protein
MEDIIMESRQAILDSRKVGRIGEDSVTMTGTFPAINTTGNDTAYYKFATGDILDDVVGAYDLTDHGTVTNGVDPIAGTSSAKFSGANYFTQGTLTDVMPAALAIDFWMKPTSLNGYIVFKEGSAANHLYQIYITGGWIVPHINVGGTVKNCLSSNQVIPNTWCHVVVNVDTVNGMRMWVNGMLSGVNTTATTLPTGGTSTDLFIGCYKTPSDYFNGEITQLRIKDATLTQANVTAMYGASGLGGATYEQIFAGRNYTLTELTTKFGVGAVDAYYPFPAADLLNDASANAYNLTGSNVTDADNCTGIMNTAYGVDLNGTNEYMYQATLWDAMPDNFCINCWFKCNDCGPAASSIIFHKQGSAANHYFLVAMSTVGDVYFDWVVGGVNSPCYSQIQFPDAVSSGWNMLTVTWDKANGARIFINAVQTASCASSATSITGGTTTDMTIGRLATGATNFYAGKLANVLFLDYLMSQEDINWLYATALTLPSLLDGKDFQTFGYVKPVFNGNKEETEIYEVARESGRLLMQGGGFEPTDFVEIYGRR